MPTTRPRGLVEVAYAAAAQDYLRSLPLEHFMEATPQASQRKITLESLDLVHARRPEVQLFNELLVQYPIPGQKRPGQVVPDNMVVVCEQEIKAEGSYDIPLQPVGPFWMLEYVSKSSRRKDYDDNFDKYEKDLKVPYYLTFYPENQEMTLYRLRGRRYKSVHPNDAGRCPLSDLELEMAILDGWVRFWFRGELLPLPAEMQHELDETRRQLADAQRQNNVLQQEMADKDNVLHAAQREIERLRAQLDETRRRP